MVPSSLRFLWQCCDVASCNACKWECYLRIGCHRDLCCSFGVMFAVSPLLLGAVPGRLLAAPPGNGLVMVSFVVRLGVRFACLPLALCLLVCQLSRLRARTYFRDAWFVLRVLFVLAFLGAVPSAGDSIGILSADPVPDSFPKVHRPHFLWLGLPERLLQTASSSSECCDSSVVAILTSVRLVNPEMCGWLPEGASSKLD